MRFRLKHLTITRFATERTYYGAILGDGVAKRPAMPRHDLYYEAGEEMIICTNGEIMTVNGWAKVRKGKVEHDDCRNSTRYSAPSHAPRMADRPALA